MMARGPISPRCLVRAQVNASCQAIRPPLLLLPWAKGCKPTQLRQQAPLTDTWHGLSSVPAWVDGLGVKGRARTPLIALTESSAATLVCLPSVVGRPAGARCTSQCQIKQSRLASRQMSLPSMSVAQNTAPIALAEPLRAGPMVLPMPPGLPSVTDKTTWREPCYMEQDRLASCQMEQGQIAGRQMRLCFPSPSRICSPLAPKEPGGPAQRPCPYHDYRNVMTGSDGVGPDVPAGPGQIAEGEGVRTTESGA